MAAGHGAPVIEPKQFVFTGQAQRGLFFLIALGVIGAVMAFVIGGEMRGYMTLLIGSYYFLCLAIAGVFFCAINHLSKAGWSVTVRRVAEGFGNNFPLGAVIVLVVAWFSHHTIYEWAHPEVIATDLTIQGKAAYLNPTGFMVRLVVAMLVLGFLGQLMIRNSLNQDKQKTPGFTVANVRNAALYLLVFAVGFSIINYDLIMSLEPHWFSTMFPIYTFSGMFYSGLALMAVFVVGFMKRGLFGSYVNKEHLHDIGKFMFAFTVFWGYIAFSQFMLIWYANWPEEITYYLRRWNGDWKILTLALIVAKFLIPFVLLLPQRMKRNPAVLEKVGIWMLIAHFIEMCWMTLPAIYAVYKKGKTPVGGDYHLPIIPELLCTVGFLGLFVYLSLRFLSKNNVVPVGDPRLHEALHHHT